MKDISRLSGIEKAAILIMSVGLKSSETMLKTLKSKEIEKITMEVARMGPVEPRIVDAVIREYHALMNIQSNMVNGGVDQAQEILNSLGDYPDAERIAKKLRTTSVSTVFDEFQEVKVSHIAGFLRNEHPQVVALIFSQLRVEKSAELLKYLEEETQSEVMHRLAVMEEISPDVITEIEDVIKDNFGGMSAQGEGARTGTSIVAQILNGADAAVEKNVLDSISKRDEVMANQIKEQMFLFEDILLLDDRTMQTINLELDKNDLVVGLKGSSDELMTKFFSNMSGRATEMLQEDMDALGPVPLADVKEAQQKILRKIKDMDEEGKISMKILSEDELVQ